MPSSPCPLAWAQVSAGTHGTARTAIPCDPSPASRDCPILGVPHCNLGALKSKVEPHLLGLIVGVWVLSCPCSYPDIPVVMSLTSWAQLSCGTWVPSILPSLPRKYVDLDLCSPRKRSFQMWIQAVVGKLVFLFFRLAYV